MVTETAILGRHLLVLIDPFQDQGRAAAIDSTTLAAHGGVWHKKHREAGIVPHTSIDTEAGWAKSGWHGWVYGWKLHLVTTKRGSYPHTDDGVEVRRIFHQLRSHAIENFNAQFKAIFNCLGQVPTRGLLPTRRYVLGAVLVYQLALLRRFENGDDLRVGLKPYLQAA